MIFRTLSATRFGISVEKICIWFFHKSGSLTLTLAGALICFFTAPFHKPKCPYGYHLYVSAIKIEKLILNHKKNGWRERIKFFTLCVLIQIFIVMSKFSVEACPQVQYWLVFNKMKDTSYHIMSQKDQKLKRKFVFDIPKLKFQNKLKHRTSSCLDFLRPTGL